MIKNFEIKKMAEHRFFYECKKTNKRNEKLTIEITECYYNNKDTKSLPNLWLKNRYTKKLYDNAIFINCYVTDKNRECREKYNPTIKLSEDKKRYIINFDWLLEVNEENKKILLDEIYKRFIESEM